MTIPGLAVSKQPSLRDGRMVLAFSGWMDGGDVSTGSLGWLLGKLNAQQVAEIQPQGFYIYNFPGPMELSALFRPNARLVEGTVEPPEFPENTFYCDEDNRLILFSGKEPNLAWEAFAESIFSFARQSGVTSIYFIGSYGGSVPHTREPRLTTCVSHDDLKPIMTHYGLRLANYEGPSAFPTYMISIAAARGFRMASLVAEIPPYVQGTNPRCIEAIIRKLLAILEIDVEIEDLQKASAAWEQRVSRALGKKPDVEKLVGKLEEAYDNEVFDTELGDLKEWLEEKGIRLD